MTGLVAAALHVMVIAGGDQPKANHHSHLEHVRGLRSVALDRGVPAERVTVFWADGADPEPDRAILRFEPPEDEWLVRGTPLDRATEPGPELLDTRFPFEVLPAKREAIASWLEEHGSRLGGGDTLLVAVTDHGREDHISLWGEEWSVEQVTADLGPVPAGVRVVLWMSQCHSGSFVPVARARANTCAVFSAEPALAAYGCVPELAARPDLGHFSQLLGALTVTGSVAAAHDETLLWDDTPDTQHLSSDALLFDALERQAQARGTTIERLVDNRLPAARPDAPERVLAARVAARFGLGAVPDYGTAERLLEELDAVAVHLRGWAEHRAGALAQTLDRFARPHVRGTGSPKSYKARLNARRRVVGKIRRAARKERATWQQLRRLHADDTRAVELQQQLEVQQAAAIRVQYLYRRLAGAGTLDGEDLRRYADLRSCEEAPLWKPAPLPEPPPAGPPYTPRPLPPVSELWAATEGLRPGFLGMSYREERGTAVVTRLTPGGPALAAGLQVGDRVKAIDGRALKHTGDLARLGVLARPGATALLDVGRGRESLVRPLVVAALPLPPPVLRPADAATEGDVVPALGLVPHGAEIPPIGEGRPTVLFFWSTRCRPCRAAVEPLRSFAAAKHADVIAVTPEDRETVARSLARNPLPFPVAHDEDGFAHAVFAVQPPLPAFAVIDAGGRLLLVKAGFRDALPLQ